jgi:hypothetical protein
VAGSLPWARVTGLIDSSWGIDIEPYQPQNVDEAAVTTFQNRIYDSSCTQALGPAEAHRCGDWEVVESYLDTPTFFFINQRDHKKLEGHGVVAPYDAGETAWINDTFIPSLISSFDLIEPNDGLYSPNLTFHTMVTNDRFFRPYIDGLSPADVFANWHFGRSGPTRLIGE